VRRAAEKCSALAARPEVAVVFQQEALHRSRRACLGLMARTIAITAQCPYDPSSVHGQIGQAGLETHKGGKQRGREERRTEHARAEGGRSKRGAEEDK